MSVILWIDLETTGVDPHRDPIVEIGAVLTKDEPGLEVVDDLDAVVSQTDAVVEGGPTAWQKRLAGNDYVRKMHEENGLLEALERGQGIPLEEAEAHLLDMLERYANPRKRVPLAGSGTGHFDRNFIEAQMPSLSARLSYWSIDVGVMRRMLKLSGRGDLVPRAGDGAVKDHRAINDIRLHVEEGRHYMRVLASAEAPGTQQALALDVDSAQGGPSRFTRM